MLALVFQLWRALEVEASARRVEIERAEVVAERILRQAVGSPAAFAAAGGVGFELRGDTVVAPDVGWLDRVPAAADDDIVARDRLERAARAEFANGDAAAARRAFDDLLAVGLPNAVRLQVLAAAAWQARREGLAEREAALVTELAQRIAALKPADLGREAIAGAVAATLRLTGRDGGEPEWAAAVVPYLPASTLLPDVVDRSALERVAARRDAIRAAREVARGIAESPSGLQPGPPPQLLWWQPGTDGARLLRWLSIDEWLAAVRAAGDRGELPEWPWLVDAVPGTEPAGGIANVPYLARLQPSSASAAATGRWLLPALTIALVCAFGLVLAQQLRAQRREGEAVRAQALFLTTVTHELRTPLASIRLLGEMLAEGRARGREQEYYRMLASESGRLSMLIENVLDLGRLERGERAYDLRPTDLGDVVRETVALVEPLAGTIGVSGEGEFIARVDRSAVVQALISVLDNARKYGAAPIEVSLQRDGETIALAVRDHGAGVPAGEREAIFARFRRGEAHAHGGTPGVGIGLYLARTIARRLGGELVCSAPGDGGAGAQFTFSLPGELEEVMA